MTTKKRWILAAAILGSSIVFLDSTLVNVALPRIGRGAAGDARRRRSKGRRTSTTPTC